VNGFAAIAKLADSLPDLLSGSGATAVAKLTGALFDLLLGSGVTLASALFSTASSLAMAPDSNSLVKDSLFKEAPQPARSPVQRIAATATLLGMPLVGFATIVRERARIHMREI
jgi:hypothetical protein